MALISVLVAILVITPVVYKVAYQQKIALTKSYASKSNLTLIADALAVEAWARQILQDDSQANSHDSYAENWALPLAPTVSDVSTLSSKIIDLNSKLNLNNLLYSKDNTFVDMLHRLFVSLGIEEGVTTNILNALQDWQDPDNQSRAIGGAEDDFYLLLPKPYRVANNQLTHISELKLVRGMTQEIYDKIKPFVSVLPGQTKVNINTASKVTLEAIFPKKSYQFLLSNTYQNAKVEYTKLSDFMQNYKITVEDTIPAEIVSHIDVSSDYFMAEIGAKLGNEKINLLSFLHKDKAVTTIYRYIDN